MHFGFILFFMPRENANQHLTSRVLCAYVAVYRHRLAASAVKLRQHFDQIRITNHIFPYAKRKPKKPRAIRASIGDINTKPASLRGGLRYRGERDGGGKPEAYRSRRSRGTRRRGRSGGRAPRRRRARRRRRRAWRGRAPRPGRRRRIWRRRRRSTPWLEA